MKKDSGPYKKIKIYCYIVGLTAFLTAFFVGIFLLHNLEKNEKTTGKYMAQVTEKRVRARLDQYIMLSNLLGNYISAGENLDENTFSELAEKIPNEDGVIKAFELAPEGIVTDIYPKQENEGAFGLDMLQEHERKKDAVVARDSGKYTIGGPCSQCCPDGSTLCRASSTSKRKYRTASRANTISCARTVTSVAHQ